METKTILAIIEKVQRLDWNQNQQAQEALREVMLEVKTLANLSPANH